MFSSMTSGGTLGFQSQRRSHSSISSRPWRSRRITAGAGFGSSVGRHVITRARDSAGRRAAERTEISARIPFLTTEQPNTLLSKSAPSGTEATVARPGS